MKKLLAVMSVLVTMVASQTKAAVSIDFTVADFRAQNGSIVGPDAIALLIADTSGGLMATLGNDLAFNSSLALNTPLTKAGGTTVGLILGRWDINAGSTTDGQLVDTAPSFSLGVNGVAQGQNLYVIWFPTLTLASAQPGIGASYGVFRDPSVTPEFGDHNWTVPADGFGGLIEALSASAGGSFANSALQANFQVVPEPSTVFLVGMGLAGAWVLRRRKKS